MDKQVEGWSAQKSTARGPPPRLQRVDSSIKPRPLPGVLMKTLQSEMLADQKHTGKGEGRNLMDSLLEFHTFGHESIPKKASYVEVANSMTR